MFIPKIIRRHNQLVFHEIGITQILITKDIKLDLKVNESKAVA